jgi:hypothetical protein
MSVSARARLCMTRLTHAYDRHRVHIREHRAGRSRLVVAVVNVWQVRGSGPPGTGFVGFAFAVGLSLAHDVFDWMRGDQR